MCRYAAIQVPRRCNMARSRVTLGCSTARLSSTNFQIFFKAIKSQTLCILSLALTSFDQFFINHVFIYLSRHQELFQPLLQRLIHLLRQNLQSLLSKSLQILRLPQNKKCDVGQVLRLLFFIHTATVTWEVLRHDFWDFRFTSIVGLSFLFLTSTALTSFSPSNYRKQATYLA